MKKTLIVYFSAFIVIGLLLYFFSMSWMNFLFKPYLNKEISQFLNGADRLHPEMTDETYSEFSKSINQAIQALPVFTTQYDYLRKIGPSFKLFKDTFTYIDFWEESLFSTSVFPVDFLLCDSAVIVNDSIGNVIPRNAEITKINDTEITEIMTIFGDLIYAETEDEKYFWVLERDYLNLYPEFFKSDQYSIEYKLNEKTYNNSLSPVPWQEYMNWKKRLFSNQFSIFKNEKMTIMKVHDLNYDNNKIHQLRVDMEKIIESSPEILVVDLSNCQGIDTNYYTLQLLLSFLTENKDSLIPRQYSAYTEQSNKTAIIPQENTYNGELYFLISKYSIYPLVRALIAFSINSGTGKLIGELPLSELDYFSNPFKEPLYNSYLTPEINRLQNKFNVELISDLFYFFREFDADEYLLIQKNNEETANFISDTLL